MYRAKIFSSIFNVLLNTLFFVRRVRRPRIHNAMSADEWVVIENEMDVMCGRAVTTTANAAHRGYSTRRTRCADADVSVTCSRRQNDHVHRITICQIRLIFRLRPAPNRKVPAVGTILPTPTPTMTNESLSAL
jgi:hypothetical protein